MNRRSLLLGGIMALLPITAGASRPDVEVDIRVARRVDDGTTYHGWYGVDRTTGTEYGWCLQVLDGDVPSTRPAVEANLREFWAAEDRSAWLLMP